MPPGKQRAEINQDLTGTKQASALAGKVALERNSTINRILAPELVPGQHAREVIRHVNIPQLKGFSDVTRIKVKNPSKGSRGALAINLRPEATNIEIQGSRM